MKQEDRIKSELKQFYLQNYQDAEDQEAATRGFIFFVIQTISNVIKGERAFDGCSKRIAEIVEEGINNNVDWMLLAECYQDLLPKPSKKKKGQFYTPGYVAEHMVDKIIEGLDIVENPQIKILDPSCGGGVFLVKAFDRLVDKILLNLDRINKRHPHLNLTPKNVGRFVAGNIYGIDMDPLGVELARLQLSIKSGIDYSSGLFLYCDDFLSRGGIQTPGNGFDVVLGNPPYIGHKKLPVEYRRYIKSKFPGILVDKGDISYCFIKKGIDLLNEKGILAYVISRYFMEAPGGEGIRGFLMREGYMYQVIDFYGNRALEGIQVDPLIFFFRKEKAEREATTRVIKVTNRNIKGDQLFNNLARDKGEGYKTFEVGWNKLDVKGWRMVPEHYSTLLQKIEKQCEYTLDRLVINFQGIITGCDSAFVISPGQAEEEDIEEELLKKWIKNSYVDKFTIRRSDRLLIYTDIIDEVSRFAKAINHILPYKERLEKRRECRRGVRKWYQLQWGRDPGKFERHKIVYPYKSSCNRFALDYNNCYFSADVYAFFLKDEFRKLISHEYLAGILNSNLYNFYFKCFGKKLGADMFEYYPNTVLRLGVKVQHVPEIEEIVRLIVSSGADKEKLFGELNVRVYKLFGLTDEEIAIVEEDLVEK